ncbi:serine/threonine-protein phosphatase 4 regulatory subunit 4-like isoform X1 [Tachypleus tridentatus]|uniref:serine/threonine-protein phosphatase 4 regulatory subunit 4-like isoform X1 n=1 Tax=Tachypleus tridentatus TaxID=6853 RepID=UPI003FD1C467
MWLEDDDRCSPTNSAIPEIQNEKKTCTDKRPRCNSPPLEGGESPCDFFYPTSGPEQVEQRIRNLEVKEIDDGHNLSNPQVQLAFSPPHDDRLGDGTPFFSLFSQEFVPSNTFTQTFLQGILSFVESRDPVVANAWMETLLDVIDLLPKEIIKRDLLTLAVNKGQLSQPVSSRLLCCKMVGKISTKFDPYIIKKEILPVVQSLCQDVDFEVRGCMCRQLDAVARGIGLEATKSALLPELVELANDEESHVRLAGIETVVRMLPMLDDETCIQTVIPLVKKCCENFMKTKDAALPVVAKELGKLCCGLSVNLSSEQRMWFLQYYQQLAGLILPTTRSSNQVTNKNPMPDVVPQVENQDVDRFTECRHACAYNFPAMVLFAETQNFYRELYKTFRALTTDPSSSVRRTIACGIHEVAKLLGTKACFIKTELIQLLKDESLEVIKGLVVHLPETLEAITSSNELRDEKEKESLENLVEALLICEEATSQTSNWRLYADFLSRLVCVVQCFPGEHLTFVPLLLNRLHTARPIPCRLAAAYTLLVIVRNIPLLDRRVSIIERLIADLCHGRSCHSRMLFISVCQLVMELFSKTFFKQHFFRPLLELAYDPVPNIRLRLCSVLPQLKSLIMIPVDSPLLQELESCVSRLMTNEKDRDIIAAVGLAIEELDKIEVSVEPGSQRSSFAEPEVDFEDLRKEVEERKLLELEDKLRKEFKTKQCKSDSKSCPGSLTRKGKIPVRKDKPASRSSNIREENENQPLRSCRSLSPLRATVSAPSSPIAARAKRTVTLKSDIHHKRKSSGYEVCNLVSKESNLAAEKDVKVQNNSSKGSSPNSSNTGKVKGVGQVRAYPRTPVPSRKAVASAVNKSQTGTRIPTPHHLGLVKTAAGDRCPSPLPSPTGQPGTLDKLLPSLLHPIDQLGAWDTFCSLPQATELLPTPVLAKSSFPYGAAVRNNVISQGTKPFLSVSSECLAEKSSVSNLVKSPSSDSISRTISTSLCGNTSSKQQSIGKKKSLSAVSYPEDVSANSLELPKRPVTPHLYSATFLSGSKIPTPKSTLKHKSFTGSS